MSTGVNPRKTDALIDISENNQDSVAIDIGEGQMICRLIMPAALTGTSMSFKTSHDGVTYNPLYDEVGTLISVVIGTSRSVSLGNLLQHFYGVRFLKLRSGSAEASDRTIGVVHRPAH